MITQKYANISSSIQYELSVNALKIRANIIFIISAHNIENHRCILFLVLYNNLHNKIYKIPHKVITHQTYRIFKNDKSSVQMSEKFRKPARISAIHRNRYIPLKILVNRVGW